MQLWSRPWALWSPQHRHEPVDNVLAPSSTHLGNCWLYCEGSNLPNIGGKRDVVEPVTGFGVGDRPRQLALLPLPVRHKPALQIKFGTGQARLQQGALPERCQKEVPSNESELLSHRLFQRAEDVWDRLSEVQTALSDPAELWAQLERLWRVDDAEREPRMDIIVQHALHLPPVLETLEHNPRQMLRRTHKMMPISRVQEMDRRTMNWLVRQQGETMAERAGQSQRLLGVTREENFDTLENRVLRAYLELARQQAKDYLDRHAHRKHSKRYRLVREFRTRVIRMDRALSEASVRLAEPGVTPNYALLSNARYRKIWDAWKELLKKAQKTDEIWRWQARSWEEFCALQVMVALHGVAGAQLIAASPLRFHDEQQRGSWIEHVNPMGVFYLPEQGLVVEVQYRPKQPDAWRADLAAPLWLRYGKVNDTLSFHRYIAIWPNWSATTLDHSDLSDLTRIVERLARHRLAGALLVQPALADEASQSASQGAASGLTIGAKGAALSIGMARLSDTLIRHLTGVTA